MGIFNKAKSLFSIGRRRYLKCLMKENLKQYSEKLNIWEGPVFENIILKIRFLDSFLLFRNFDTWFKGENIELYLSNRVTKGNTWSPWCQVLQQLSLYLVEWRKPHKFYTPE